MTLGRREAIAGGAAFALAAAAPGPARRVVSLTPCLDLILVAVADPSQIVALSHWSRQPGASSVGEVARRFPFTFETAEEVIALAPDLVLTGWNFPLATRHALTRMGIRVMLVKTPDTIAQSLDQIGQIARVVGRPARGEAEIQRIRAALAAAMPPPGARRVSALILQRGGFTTGPGTLLDELLRITGFQNAAAERYGMTATGNLPLEMLLADPPEVLLSGEPNPGPPGWEERVLRHPALARVAARMKVVPFPAHLMFCGGPNLIQSAAILTAARRQALGA